jgi:hypothetical protein
LILKFYAREGLVREPGRRPFIGQAAVYLGRQFVPPSTTPEGVHVSASYPATKDGFEWDTARHEHAHTEHVMKAARKGAFWPADKATAEAVGMAFVEVEFKDGAFAEKAKPAPANRTSSKGMSDA